MLNAVHDVVRQIAQSEPANIALPTTGLAVTLPAPQPLVHGLKKNGGSTFPAEVAVASGCSLRYTGPVTAPRAPSERIWICLGSVGSSVFGRTQTVYVPPANAWFCLSNLKFAAPSGRSTAGQAAVSAIRASLLSAM